MPRTAARYPRGRTSSTTALLVLAALILTSVALLPTTPVSANGAAAPTDVKVIGKFEALRVEWTKIADETNLTSYSVTGTPSAAGSALTCSVPKGDPTQCEFSGLTYGAEYVFVVSSVFTDSTVSPAAGVTGRAGISMSVVARAAGTTNALTTPQLENDIFVSALVPGSLTGFDFDLWACPDDSVIPRDNQSSELNGDCDGPNIEGRGGRDDNTFLLGSGRYGRFCNWLIILHDYDNGAHSNWFGPLLGADGQPLPGCTNTLAAAPGSPPTPPTPPAASNIPAASPIPNPGGGLPVTPPGSSSGSVGGVPTPPTPARPNVGSAEFRVGTVEMRVDLAVAGAGSVGGTGAAPVIRAVRDRVATIAGGGMQPGGIAEVWLPLPGGGSRQVALLPIAGDGTFNGALPFTGELDGQGPLPIGDQTIQLFGRDANGQLTVINFGVRIEQPGPLTPEPDRGQGGPPALSPGQSLATFAGVPTPVTVTPLPDARSTRIEGSGWLMDVDVPEGSVLDEGGAPIIEVVLGDRSVVRGDGFMPGTRAYVWLMSTPTFLGQVTVNADGTFSGSVPIRGVAVGQHTLQLSGVGTDGYIRAANLGVIVTSDGMPRPTRINAGEGPAPTVPLPFTGMLLALLVGVGAFRRIRTTVTG